MVQGDNLGNHPYIPALTPDGFAAWMSRFIQATPGPEARRLDHVVAALPIDAAGSTLEGNPERLPKQLSRHLFPLKPTKETEKRVGAALIRWIEDMSPSNSPSSSWSSIFRDVICQSRSPEPRQRSSREQGPRRYGNIGSDGYIKVPAEHSSRSRQRPSKHYSQDRRRSEPSGRYPAETHIEKASRRARDMSPRRSNPYRERSPRPSKRRVRQPHGSPRFGPAAPRTSPSSRECSPETAGGRASHYALFQGRDPGQTYEEFDSVRERETSTARRTGRAPRRG